MSRYRSAFSATAFGILEQLKPRYPIGAFTPRDRLDQKTCLITGANSGLGLAIAKEAAKRGAKIIMACRNEAKQAQQIIQKSAPNAEIVLVPLDLARLESVKAFCQTLKRRDETIDVLVLNAGTVPRGSRKTADGFEEGFQVNFLANVALVRTLLQFRCLPLDETREKEPSRVIFISSEAHRSAPPIDWDTLGKYQEFGISQAVTEYGKNKLLLTCFATALDRRINDEGLRLAVHALCPGAVRTRIAREAPALSRPLLSLVFALFFSSPDRAARPVLYLASSRSLARCSGLYLHKMAVKPAAPYAIDEQRGAQLWHKCDALLSPFGFTKLCDGAGA